METTGIHAVSTHTFKLLLIESKKELWKSGFPENYSKRYYRLNKLIYQRFRN